MPGFIPTDTKENSEFTIIIRESNFNSTKPVISKRETKIKNTEGAHARRLTYTYNSIVSVTYNVNIKLKDGTVLTSNFESSETKKVSVSEDSPTRTRMVFYKNLEREKDNITVDAFNTAFAKLKESYCFVDKEVLSSFVSFKYKDFDYTELNRIASEGNGLITSKIDNDILKIINQYIRIFQSELEEFDKSENHKSRINSKLKSGLLYNISLCYFYLGDF